MTRREWQIALPILLALAACAAGLIKGLQLRGDARGPEAMRVLPSPQGERVALVFDGALHVTDAEGRRLVRQPVAELGLAEAPNDMDWTVDREGHIEAWLFDDRVPRVLRCAWDEARPGLRDCAAALSGAQLKLNPRSRAVHLAVDRLGERIFLADAKSAQVQVFDLAGRVLARSQPDVSLDFPNRLRFLGDDTLAVADNDHHRIVWLDVAAGRPMRVARTLSSHDHGQARPGRGLVGDAAFGADGTLWMLALRPGQKDGDLLVFDADRRPIARADLPAGADPLIVEALGSAALVADFAGADLYRVDARGRWLGPFGDAPLRAELSARHDQLRTADRWFTASLAAGGLVIAVGIVLALRFGERPPRAGALDRETAARLAELRSAAHAPALPVVLTPTPAYLKALRRQIVWSAGLALLSAAAVLVPVAMLGGALKTAAGIGPMALGVVVLGGVSLLALSILQRRIGSTRLEIGAEAVDWIEGERRKSSAKLKDVYASAGGLLIGARVLRWRLVRLGSPRRPGEPMFDPQAIERALLSRLPATQLVDDPALMRLQLQRQPLALKLLLALPIATWVIWQIARLFER
ncbi:hypothetical protein [Caldimonas sp. KR1-144]|uniref:hypothetical protein n=1 Tax=Caldimonas sp. KR1-144 TaxID=3400911 RepID=UPI003C091CAE